MIAATRPEDERLDELERGYRGQVGNWRRRGSREATPAPRDVAQQRRAAGMSWHELADRTWNQAKRDPGARFAAKQLDADDEAKSEARERVLALFGRDRYPGGLKILTMPGVFWRFEQALLFERERRAPAATAESPRGGVTNITAIERSEAIYRLSLRFMPGAAAALHTWPTARYATASVGTNRVPRYHRCSFEDYAFGSRADLHGAWIDLNGPLNRSRVRALAALWERVKAGGTVVVTALDGRQDPLTLRDMQTHGGALPWLAAALADAVPEEEWRYASPAPMWQVAFRKPPCVGGEQEPLP